MTVRGDVLLIVTFWYPVCPPVTKRWVILDLFVLAFEREVGVDSENGHVQPSIMISFDSETETWRNSLC